MKEKRMTYRDVESAFYETMRITKGSSSHWSKEKEGNALIDPDRTPDNFEVLPHHPCLNPSQEAKKNRGQGIAEYHKSVAGKAPRMAGSDAQMSKAQCVIITLPKEYIKNDIQLTDDEYEALLKYGESEIKAEPRSEAYLSAKAKTESRTYSEEEKDKIREFFTSALNAWLFNAGIRREDLLYAVVHMDESTVHMHVAALPTVIKDNGDITFSSARFNNIKTGYYDTLHQNIIDLMDKDGIDASGLINGTTKGKGFIPADNTREMREEQVQIKRQVDAMKQYQEQKQTELESLTINMINGINIIRFVLLRITVIHWSLWAVMGQ